MSGLNFAPDLLTRFKLKASTNPSNEKISCSVPGFHPNNDNMLIKASEKYPSSRYPRETSPVFSLTYSNGNLHVVHAAAHPEKSLELQPDSVLLWGHPKFERIGRKDGLWIAHGHTIVTTPAVQSGRISVDTGAYATGRLTAAIINKGEVEFCQVHR